MKIDTLTENNSSFVSEKKFTEIYSLCSNKVYNLAYKMTGDRDISNDITQEAFIKIYLELHTFRGDSRIFTWIYSIAKNICLRYLENNKQKSYRTIEKLIEKVSCKTEYEKYDEQEGKYYINQIKDGCLLGVLRCLSFYQRIVFILTILYDLSVEDVSIIINKSQNSTRILIHRARKNIREFLCNNCSLYDDANTCRCKNLISFSLKQGWIEKYKPTVSVEIIESEIKAVKSEINLYRTISSERESNELKEKILSIINNRKLIIFQIKK